MSKYFFVLAEFILFLAVIVWLFVRVNRLERQLLLEQAKREFVSSHILQVEKPYDSVVYRNDTVYFYKDQSLAGSITVRKE